MHYDNLLLFVLSCYYHLKPILKFRTPSVNCEPPGLLNYIIVPTPPRLLELPRLFGTRQYVRKYMGLPLLLLKSVKFAKISLLDMCSKYSLQYLFHVWSFFNDSAFINFFEFFSIQPSPHVNPILENNICVFSKCFPNSRVSK